MSRIGSIASAVKGIFSAPKMLDNVFDKDKGLLTQVGRWAGLQQYTPEEKALHDKSMGDAVRGFAVATLGENTDRSKTRRKLASKWFDLQIWLIKLQVACFFTDKLSLSLDGPALTMSADFAAIAFNQGIWAVTSGIGLFFWGSHTLRSSKWAKADK